MKLQSQHYLSFLTCSVILRSFSKFCRINRYAQISLVTQWLRIRLPLQGTWVRALVWEDPTYRGATKPVHNSY